MRDMAGAWNQGSGGRSGAPEERERVGHLLKQAFPLGEAGTFTGIVEAIGHVAEAPRRR
jgi:hypothetical protein